jgi:heme/copper-type cytochrome/quinol oxidase subunit 4
MVSFVELTIGFAFVIILLTISLPMDVEYHETLRNAAYIPVVRLAAITAVVALAFYSPLLAMLGVLIVFFWLADIQLLTKKYA